MNWLLSTFRSIFPKKIATGLVLDTPEELEQLPQHEMFAGGGEVTDWSQFCPPFRYQGPSYWCTAFAGTNIGSIFEKQESGRTVLFSPMELFYRSNGQLYGNTLINAAQAMKDGFALETDVPTRIPDGWNKEILERYRLLAKATPPILERGKPYRVKGFANVIPLKSKLEEALKISPLMIAVGIGRGYFLDPAPKQTQYAAYHAVVLVEIDKDGCYVIFDSTEQRQDFNGFHRLAPDYEILGALSFIDLPDDWKEIQNTEVQGRYGNVLNHYGLKRDFEKEKMSAKWLTKAAQQNPTLASFIGKDFTVLINCLTYGSYSVQDILNHCYSLRKFGKPIWNLDLIRSEARL